MRGGGIAPPASALDRNERFRLLQDFRNLGGLAAESLYRQRVVLPIIIIIINKNSDGCFT